MEGAADGRFDEGRAKSSELGSIVGEANMLSSAGAAMSVGTA